MSCKYCEYPTESVLSTNKRQVKGEDTSIFEYNKESGEIAMFIYDEWFPNSSMMKVGVKYCPFCGAKLKAPSQKAIEDRRHYEAQWEEKRKKLDKEQKRKKREREKWLKREYEKNPYDPTKPRLKNKDFRNAVKYLAKYMKIEEFYWDDNLRRLTGCKGGYINVEEKTIGPCWETNGVMEAYQDSGKTYTVEELCYGYKEEGERNEITK